jgi:hypothetical protein
MKWLECNIYLKDYNRTNEVLKDFVKPYIKELYDNEVEFTWHYFREPQICLRIGAYVEAVKLITVELCDRLHQLEGQSDLYDYHIFGAFAQEGKEYIGEADFYGEDVWELCYKRWEAGSNLALQLITVEPIKSIPFHYTRDIHLFENQLGLEYSDAITIYLKWIQKLMECDKDFDYSKYLPVLQKISKELFRPSEIKGI